MLVALDSNIDRLKADIFSLLNKNKKTSRAQVIDKSILSLIQTSKILILASTVAKYPINAEIFMLCELSIIRSLSKHKSVRLPIMIIPEMAFVTLIRGVCKAGVTDHTTKYPTNIAKTKIIKFINEGSTLSTFYILKKILCF